eukprot:3690540-Prymnesium_polylepis.1
MSKSDQLQYILGNPAQTFFGEGSLGHLLDASTSVYTCTVCAVAGAAVVHLAATLGVCAAGRVWCWPLPDGAA